MPIVLDPEHVARLRQINAAFFGVVPHNVALGIELTELDAARARLRLPWNPALVGNPATGVLHGGAITTLMDACCGAAVFMALAIPSPIATLDLRIDYLKPAAPGQDVWAHCHCFKVGRNVAFVRGLAYHDDEGDPIAAAAGSFMLGTKSRSRPRDPAPRPASGDTP
jgi:uncharacterized protein (TIGR00369 family)